MDRIKDIVVEDLLKNITKDQIIDHWLKKWNKDTRDEWKKNNRKILYRTNSIWNIGKHNDTNLIGNMMNYLNYLKTHNEIVTFETFQEGYFKQIKSKAQTFDNIKKWVEDPLNIDIPTDVLIVSWFIRVFDESFKGNEDEINTHKLIIEAIKKDVKFAGRNIDVVHSSAFIDRTYGVDFIVIDLDEPYKSDLFPYGTKSGKPLAALQVKGTKSYFTGRTGDLYRTRVFKMPKKFQKFEDKYGVNVFYIITEDIIDKGIVKESFIPWRDTL